MKLLAIGDLHYELDALTRLVQWASEEEIDGVFITGDLASYHQITSHQSCPNKQQADQLYAKQVNAIFDTLALIDAPIFFVPGNHDLPSVSPELRDTTKRNPFNLDLFTNHQVIRFQDQFAVFGIGGSTYTPYHGPFEWEDDLHSRDKISANLQQIATETHTIMLSHCPPKWTMLDRGVFGDAIGSELIRELMQIYHPKLLICGHVHEAIGIEIVQGTLSINAGSITGQYSRECQSRICQCFAITADSQFDEVVVESHRFFLDSPHVPGLVNSYLYRHGELYPCNKREPH